MRRSVLVTGASSGIGLQTTLELARLGFDVVGTARSEAKAEVVARAAAEAGVEVRTEILDVVDLKASSRVIENLDLYGLVNNAGYMNVGAIEDVAPEDALRQFEALVLGSMHLSNLAFQGMRRRGVGRIVFLSSVAAHLSGPFVGWYGACKHALEAVTDAFRAEVASFGIDIIAVEPGAFRTAIWQKAADDLLARREGSVHAAAYARILDYLPAFEARVPDPIMVAREIGEALTAGKPQHRYQVGADSGPLEFVNYMTPPYVQDRLKAAMLKVLPRLPLRRNNPAPPAAPVVESHGPH